MILRNVVATVMPVAVLVPLLGTILLAQDGTKATTTAADALANTGFAQLEAGNHVAAEDAFRRLREAAPNDLRGIVGLAEAYFAENRQEDAIQLLRTESARWPDREELLAALGNLFTHSGRYDEALAVYKDWVTRSPKSAEALFSLGDTYRALGDLTNAAAMFKRASEAAPSNAKIVLQLAMVLERMGLRTEAAPVYERALQIDPDSALALNNLAYMMVEDGRDVSRAMEMAQRAHLKAPASPDITDTLGFIYIKLNFGRDAVAIYQPLIEAQPRSPIYHYHFALALLQTGDKAGALRELNLALQIGAQPDDDRKIRELLGTLNVR